MAGDHDQDLGAAQRGVGLAQETAEERDLVQERERFQLVLVFFFDQAADDHRLAVVDRHVGLDFASGQFRRLRRAGQDDHVRAGQRLVDLQGDQYPQTG